jgi:hypothetical protein
MISTWVLVIGDFSRLIKEQKLMSEIFYLIEPVLNGSGGWANETILQKGTLEQLLELDCNALYGAEDYPPEAHDPMPRICAEVNANKPLYKWDSAARC